MMKEWKKVLLRKGNDPQEVVEEDEPQISNGCCYFHDQEELNEFDDVDDDNPKNT
jgi:hypothetical protein